jgi:hypothetical protein
VYDENRADLGGDVERRESLERPLGPCATAFKRGVGVARSVANYKTFRIDAERADDRTTLHAEVW